MGAVPKFGFHRVSVHEVLPQNEEPTTYTELQKCRSRRHTHTHARTHTHTDIYIYIYIYRYIYICIHTHTRAHTHTGLTPFTRNPKQPKLNLSPKTLDPKPLRLLSDLTMLTELDAGTSPKTDPACRALGLWV